MYLSSSQNPNHDPIDVLVLMQNPNKLIRQADNELEDLLDRDLKLGPAAYLYGLHGSFSQAIDEYEHNNNEEEKKGTTVRDKPYIVRSQELFVTGAMTRVKSLAKDTIREIIMFSNSTVINEESCGGDFAID
ncbi:hypothetical protein Tco_0631775 [Tanacetum coccineum]